MNEWTFAGATALARAIRAKEISAVEILHHYISRIESHDGDLNAVVVRDFERAMARAQAADRALSQGDNWGPLHGVPMTIKEAFDVEGLPTTWGFPEYASNLPTTNAAAVQSFLDSGAVLFGKTNVPVALSDWQTFNPVYGTTNNPWDKERIPGGSSGGSAAALAAGVTALEAGSDIGASIRNPAHYCGVYGHKPTFGIASSEGHALPEWRGMPEVDIAVVGPMARSANDLSVALDLMAGPDPIAAAGWRLELPPSTEKSLSEFKVGIIYTDPEAEVDDAVQAPLRTLAASLRDHGAQVFEEKKPDIDTRETYRNYVALLRGATSPFHSEDTYARFCEEVKGVDVEADGYEAQMLRATTMSHRDWGFANEIRHRMRRAWHEYFKEVDLLLCPAATTVAFPHNQTGERWERMIDVNGKPQPTTTALFWAGYSGSVHLPSTVAPAGLSSHGLPVGVQIIGPQFYDHRCIRFAQLLERDYYAFSPPPDYR